MVSFLTFRRKCATLSLVTMFICILFIGMLPIKYTPVKSLIPRYSTWHEVSTIHLMKILWRPVPTGVRTLQCTTFREPGVPRSNVYKLPYKLFSYKKSDDKINELTSKGYRDLDHFSPLMDKETKVSLLHTYMVMADALTQAGIPFMALHGALLGMYRFGSIIPWDDDLDIGVNITRWEDVRDVLSCIRGYDLFLDPVMRWSFFPSNGTMSTSMPGKKYPFVDIFFQAEDDTHVWGMQWVNRRRSLFPKQHMFPHSWGYMDGVRIPIPHNTLEILKLQYVNLDECASQKNGHLLPPTDVFKVPCSWLYPVYGNFSKNGRQYTP